MWKKCAWWCQGQLGIASIKDLNGKTVAPPPAPLGANPAQERACGRHRLQGVYGKDHADSFLMLETGRADAFVMDGSILAPTSPSPRTLPTTRSWAKC